MKQIEIMKKFDNFLILQIKKMEDHPNFITFLDKYNSWEENVQTAFKAALTLALTLVPIFFLFIFYIINSSTRSDLNSIESIIEAANQIKNQTKSVGSKTNVYFGNSISTQNELNSKMTNQLPQLGIESNKVNITSFDIIDEKNISVISADIKFKGFTNANLFTFIDFLTQKKYLKMRLNEVDIKKNSNSNLLEGILTVQHYSKKMGLN